MSPVLKRMLDASAIEPSRLDEAVTERIRRRMPHMCEVDQLPRVLAKATGALVTRLRRRNRHVLIDVSAQGLRYAESRASECWVIVPGTLPHTIMADAKGRLLKEVVELGPLANFFGSCTIEAADEACLDEATQFILQPQWMPFDR